MKFLVVLSFLLTVSPVAFGDMRIVLDCMAHKHVRVNYGAKAVKTAYKKDGKWKVRYTVEITSVRNNPPTKAYRLVPAGSGDEDYNEYDVVDPDNTSPISGASIQNRFLWVGLVDREGVGSHHCR
jgi:hypothetical protein